MDGNHGDFSLVAGMPAVTSAQMKEIERKADAAGLSYYQMMENAGAGAAHYINRKFLVSGKSVMIFCGKGNNGGDGFVTARKFTEMGASVTLLLAEGEPRTPDAVTNYEQCRKLDIPVIDLTVSYDESSEKGIDGKRAPERLTKKADLIVDAIYGTGFHGNLRDSGRAAARMINYSGAAVYALDIPSGLNGDTGEADAETVRADGTIAFHRMKPAHMKEGCGSYCGDTVCISIGIEGVLPD